ncbi:MAG TPA: thioesterase family protein [Alphaproteobacteria bacterium]|nr:thioesterase family protein [Alphaproteobacteria bacterium]
MTFDPADRASYRHWTEERVRFADLDPLGHANNNAIGVYFETARLAFFRDLQLHEGIEDQATVVARLAIDFRAELTFPNRLEVGTRPVRLGNSSFTYVQGLFAGAACVATAETVSVLFNLKTRRSDRLTDAQRNRLSAYL